MISIKYKFSRSSKRARWSERELALFLERLGLFLSSGMMLDAALKSIVTTLPKNRREVVERIEKQFESGISFSTALESHIKVSFTSCQIIEHGQQSGNISSACITAASLIEKNSELKRSSLSALVYPAVIAIFAGLMTLGMMRGVVPQISPILKSLNVELPLVTVLVLWLSDHLVKYGIFVFIGLTLVFVLFVHLYKRFLGTRMFAHRILAITPFVGELMLRSSMSLFLRTLGTMVGHGLPVVDAYKSSCLVVNVLPLKFQLARYTEDITAGASLSSVFERLPIGYSPAHVRPLVNMGESTGNLGDSLSRCADLIDRDVAQSLKKITSLIEPIMMIGVGSLIGVIALSILMPIYDISKVLQR